MASSPEPASFRMASEAEHLATMRAWLRGELARQDLAAHDLAALVVAVSELCTNAIEHAYAGVAGQPIDIAVRTFDDRVVIEVEHFGEPFDAAQYAAPDLESVPERGLGLYLVRQIADRLAVDARGERGTRWTLVKYRRPREDASGTAGSGL